jgi:two-component system response regulator DegU
MKSNPLAVMVVDDHKLFRTALRALIGKAKISAVVFEAENGREALEMLQKKSVDIILLDIQMPDMNGVDFLKALKKKETRPKVIMLSQFREKSLIVHCFQLGANGYLSKGCGILDLQKAVRDVMSKGTYYDDSIMSAITFNLESLPRQQKFDISPREIQVLDLLKDGQTNK